MTEAIVLVRKIIGSYANTDNKIGDSYIGALADVLISYPANIARQSAGIVRQCKFLPSVAELVDWCEKKAKPLYQHYEQERRVEQQLRERKEFEDRQAERHKRLTVQELKEKYGDWNNNWQPVLGAEDKYKPPKVDPTKPKPGSYFDMVAKHGRPIGPFEQLGDKWNPIGKAKPAMPESQSGQKTMSDAELRAYYGQREAEAAKQYNKQSKDDPFAGLED
jgi:hypothetical protein